MTTPIIPQRNPGPDHSRAARQWQVPGGSFWLDITPLEGATTKSMQLPGTVYVCPPPVPTSLVGRVSWDRQIPGGPAIDQTRLAKSASVRYAQVPGGPFVNGV